MVRKSVEKELYKTMKKKETTTPEEALRKQYKIIKGDVLKLRNDLLKGYDMARSWVEKKSSFKKVLRAK